MKRSIRSVQAQHVLLSLVSFAHDVWPEASARLLSVTDPRLTVNEDKDGMVKPRKKKKKKTGTLPAKSQQSGGDGDGDGNDDDDDDDDDHDHDDDDDGDGDGDDGSWCLLVAIQKAATRHRPRVPQNVLSCAANGRRRCDDTWE